MAFFSIKTAFIVPVFLLVLSSLNLTAALQCFHCQLKDGVGDAGCGENPPPEKYLRECARKEHFTPENISMI